MKKRLNREETLKNLKRLYNTASHDTPDEGDNIDSVMDAIYENQSDTRICNAALDVSLEAFLDWEDV